MNAEKLKWISSEIFWICVRRRDNEKKNTHSKKQVYIKIKTTHDHEYNDLNVLIIIKIIIIAW